MSSSSTGNGPIGNTFEIGNNIPAASSNGFVSPRPVYNGGGGGSLYGTSGNGFLGSSPSYGGGVDTYGSSSPFYKKEYNVKQPYTSSNSKWNNCRVDCKRQTLLPGLPRTPCGNLASGSGTQFLDRILWSIYIHQFSLSSCLNHHLCTALSEE